MKYSIIGLVAGMALLAFTVTIRAGDFFVVTDAAGWESVQRHQTLCLMFDKQAIRPGSSELTGLAFKQFYRSPIVILLAERSMKDRNLRL